MNNEPKIKLSKYLKGPIYRYVDIDGKKGAVHISASNYTPIITYVDEEENTYILLGNSQKINIKSLAEIDSICNALDNPYKTLTYLASTHSSDLAEKDYELALKTLEALRVSMIELNDARKIKMFNIYSVLDFITKKESKIKKAKNNPAPKQNDNQSQPE